MASGEGSSDRAQPTNTWMFVLALGLLIGFVIGFVLLLSRLPVDPGLSSLRTGEFVEVPADAAGDYEFYTVLADRRVPRPDALRADARVAGRASETPLAETVRAAREGAPVRASVQPATRVVPAGAQRLDRRSLAAENYRQIPTSALGQESYYLQAGNFREPGEAERARAVVLLLGLDAFIVTRRGSDGTTGHRVRIGPFFDSARLAEAKQKLSDGNIDYELIRVTG